MLGIKLNRFDKVYYDVKMLHIRDTLGYNFFFILLQFVLFFLMFRHFEFRHCFIAILARVETTRIPP